MKKILYIIAVLLIMPLIYAKLEISSIKAYVNDERVTGIDEEGGDAEVYPDDTLDFTITLSNTENTTTQAKLSGVIDGIDDGDDLTKTQDWFDISASSDKSKRLSYVIPLKARKGTYDMELKVYYKYSNGTEHNYAIDYAIKVLIKEELKEIDLKSSFNNMTTTCNNVVSTMSNCFGYINNTSSYLDELSTCKEERGTNKNNYENCNTDLTDCKARRDSLETENKQLNDRISASISSVECENQKNAAVVKAESETKGSSQTTIVIIGGIALVGFLIYNKRKKSETTSGAYFDQRL